jgi:DNA-binding XRE family transcriptional regulator
VANTLSIPHQQQIEDGFCLPASAQMALAYLGVGRAQEELARILRVRPGFGAPASNILNLRFRRIEAIYHLNGAWDDLHAWLQRQVPSLFACRRANCPTGMACKRNMPGSSSVWTRTTSTCMTLPSTTGRWLYHQMTSGSPGTRWKAVTLSSPNILDSQPDGFAALGEEPMSTQTIPLDTIKAQLLADPEVKQAYDALEPAYQIARLRIARGLTQTQLAAMVGTKQPSIARLESGASQPSVAFLQKVAAALGARLEVRLVPLPNGGQ